MTDRVVCPIAYTQGIVIDIGQIDICYIRSEVTMEEMVNNI